MKTKNKKLGALLLVVGAMAVGGNASACTLSGVTSFGTFPQINGFGGGYALNGGVKYLYVTCPTGVPWQVEIVGGQPGGKMIAKRAGGKQIEYFLKSYNTGLPWGSIANGEAISGVGTGNLQDVGIQINATIPSLYHRGPYTVPYQINLVY